MVGTDQKGTLDILEVLTGGQSQNSESGDIVKYYDPDLVGPTVGNDEAILDEGEGTSQSVRNLSVAPTEPHLNQASTTIQPAADLQQMLEIEHYEKIKFMIEKSEPIKQAGILKCKTIWRNLTSANENGRFMQCLHENLRPFNSFTLRPAPPRLQTNLADALNTATASKIKEAWHAIVQMDCSASDQSIELLFAMNNVKLLDLYHHFSDINYDVKYMLGNLRSTIFCSIICNPMQILECNLYPKPSATLMNGVPAIIAFLKLKPRDRKKLEKVALNNFMAII